MISVPPAGHRAHRPRPSPSRSTTPTRRAAIELFARAGRRGRPPGAGLPWLLFLQGGPGFGARRPVGRDTWLERALHDYRVLLLDQRGTGRSSPANRRTLAGLGSGQAQADYLAHFRADSIVADAELIRRQLTGGGPWRVLGQSFGGFCTITYLSIAPEGLREALLTGGLPGLRTTPTTCTGRPIRRWRRRTRRTTSATRRTWSGRGGSPAASPATPATLPGGGLLTVEAFQTLGLLLGTGRGSRGVTTCWRTRSLAPSCPTTSCSGRRPSSPSPPGRSTRWCTRPATRRARPRPWAAQRIRAEFPAFDAARRAGRGRAGAVHRGDDLPVDVRERSGAAPLAEAAELLAAARLAGRTCTTRPDSRPTRCPPRRRSTTTTCTCRWSSRCRPRGHPRAADLGDQRVRARRPAGQQRRGARPADRDGRAATPDGDRRAAGPLLVSLLRGRQFYYDAPDGSGPPPRPAPPPKHRSRLTPPPAAPAAAPEPGPAAGPPPARPGRGAASRARQMRNRHRRHPPQLAGVLAGRRVNQHRRGNAR